MLVAVDVVVASAVGPVCAWDKEDTKPQNIKKINRIFIFVLVL